MAVKRDNGQQFLPARKGVVLAAGGLVADGNTRVLREDGTAIGGLYQNIRGVLTNKSAYKLHDKPAAEKQEPDQLHTRLAF